MKPKFIIQKIKNIFWHLPKSIFWNFYYGFPSKKLILIGVTGTDGKTTTTNLIYKILTEAGFSTGLISTLGCTIGNKTIKTGLHTTSPDPKVIQKLLREMVDGGVTHCVLEVTAHAIDQFRFFGCYFEISAITNISHEHLDDFPTLDVYAKTKALLFSKSKIAVLNADDGYFGYIKKNITVPIITYSVNSSADYQAKNIKLQTDSLVFTVNQKLFKTDSTYHYQIYNILIAIIISQHLKLSTKLVQKIILHFPEIKGRREIIKNNLKIRTIVDFAHTPAALKETLTSLKISTKGKLIVIFGATGGRDQTKRPLMGKVVSELSDLAYITSDDTRGESVEKINQQIISGINQSRIKSNKFSYFDIPHRQDAFNLAVLQSGPGDTIIACGKGHETTILLGNTEYPWSEAEAFRSAFRNRLKSND
ncbi:UDP-N-acetylmuramyl-tripeptide synthetase [Candidatus Shapirobacteria bacterium]|nr:UDP-N-acetylmuramyl-tripeptide synthetase [Candidatus Shapirobacteria bacterium]